MEQQTKLPTSYWIISGIALLWNVMGVINFFSQILISDETLAALPEAERTMYEAFPSWLSVVFGIAVFAGLAGSIALLLKKAWAVPAFLVSLIAIVIQMGYSIFMTNSMEVLGPTSLILPIVVILFGVFMFYYSRQARAKGWLV